MKKKAKARIIKWLALALVPVVLMTALAASLYVPFVQSFAVRQASKFLSAKTGFNVDVGKINLVFPLQVHLQEVSVTNAAKDTLLYLNELDAGVNPLPLLQSEIVPVGGIHLDNVRFDTKALINGVAVNGFVGHIHLDIRRIHLIEEFADLEDIFISDLDAAIRIDSVARKTDESSQPVVWQIVADKTHLKNIALRCSLQGDSVNVATSFDDLLLTDAKVNLENNTYRAARLELVGCAAGLDALQINLTELNFAMDSLFFGGKDLNAALRNLSLKEQSGLNITAAEGRLHSDSTVLTLPQLSVRTPSSLLTAEVSMPWHSIEKHPEGNLHASLKATIGPADAAILAGLAEDLTKYRLPDTAMIFTGLIDGNANRLYIRNIAAEIVGYARMEANGIIEKLTDPNARSGELTLTAATSDEKPPFDYILRMSDGRFTLPPNTALAMTASLANREYRLDALLTEQQGKVHLNGIYNPNNQAYNIALQLDSLEPVHFLPRDSAMYVNAALYAEGRGTDLFSASTVSQLSVDVPIISYKNTTLTGLSLSGSLKDNQLQAKLRSADERITASAELNGTVRKNDVSGQLNVAVDSLNPNVLNLVNQEYIHSFKIASSFNSDLDKSHHLNIAMNDWVMREGRSIIRTKPLNLDVVGDTNSSELNFNSGDFIATATGDADWLTLAGSLSKTTDEVMRQIKTDTTLNLSAICALMPTMMLKIEAGRDNPVYNYLQDNDMFYGEFGLEARLSPETGLQADARLYDFFKDTTKVDTMRLTLRQDTTALRLVATAIKNKFRNQMPFTINVEGELFDNQAKIECAYFNGRGETGILVGVEAQRTSSGLRLHIFPEQPVIAFLPFQVNEDNYLKIKSLTDISANLRLDGAGNASLWLHSVEDEGVMQELSLEINHIDLAKIAHSSGNIAPLKGVASFSLRYMPSDNTFMFVADGGVDDLYYRDGRIGELLISAVYLPLNRSQHQFDMHFFHDRNEISGLTAIYQPNSRNDKLSGSWEINNLPLTMLNPFAGNTMTMKGELQANLKITGTEKAPILDGFVRLDSASALLTAAATRLKFDSKNIDVSNSRFTFNKYSIYAAGTNPLIVSGVVDARNISRPQADLQLTASNFQLTDAQKTTESMVYGKMLIDLNSTVKGPMNSLKMRGNLHLLGGTNMSYIMKESPLTTSDRMSDLVTFSYFRDTLPQRQRRFVNRMPRNLATMSGLDMLLSIRIDPAVKLKIDLDEISDDRIELKGGGDLSLQYTPQGETQLTGRYTFSDGMIKYNMPVISNKTLTIKDNSYIEWTGDMFDPILNLKATEYVRSSVSSDGNVHPVNFEAGVTLKQRLSAMELQFTLEALDDATVQSQLVAMGTEERSKQAVGMLLTGLYLAADGTGTTRFDMNSALNAILQTGINRLTGSLLQNGNLDIGMETTDETGESGRHTDYSFRYSQRFYNDRFNIIIGGQVSTGNVPDNYNNMFINDASLEYRLDDEGNRYAKLFYNRHYESLLEGEIARYGAGVVFRKKMRRLMDLFYFRRKTPTIVTENETNSDK
ncbi:MAG: translocation/assembly module TamB domain-containing protein [Tannerella sp.]|jgi:hypothetical protein|nr:translocation/assembly module TamB domain-containing protein [Tannerella sp.]